MRIELGGSRTRWLIAGAGGVGAAALLYASTVWSQPSTGGPVPQRVRQLETRVAQLELRLLAMERLLESKVDPTSVKSFPDEELGYDACDPPFAYDARGIKLLKKGCESHGGSDPCNPPYTVDAEGIKSLRPGCTASGTSSPCHPPYTIDADGNRIIRRECLDVGY